MKNIFIISILFLLVFLSACKKDENSITGLLEDMTTKESIANAKVNLYYSEIKSGVASSEFKLLESTTTDANGNYSFNFESRTFYKFCLTFEKDNYHTKEIIFDPTGITVSYDKHDFLAKESYLKVSIFNKAHLNHNITVTIRNVNTLCDLCCQGPFYFSGTNIDDSFTCPIVGGEEISIDIYEKDENNVRVDGMSQTNIAPIGDTIKINYIM